MLADFEIREAVEKGFIGISPFHESQLQPVSYDLSLGGLIRVPDPDIEHIDPFSRNWPHSYTLERETDTWAIPSQGFLLASTMETIRLDSTIAARVEGKSSIGRLGLAVHITAGFIDPGFEGQITLEIANTAPWSVQLQHGMAIAQIVFEQVSPPEEDYRETGRYQNQVGPTESRYNA